MSLDFCEATYKFSEKALSCGGFNSKTYAVYRHTGMGLGMLGVLPEQSRRMKSLYLSYAVGQIRMGWPSIEDPRYRYLANECVLHKEPGLPEELLQSVSYWAYTFYHDIPRGPNVNNGARLRAFREDDLRYFEINYTLKEYVFDHIKQHYLSC